MNPLKTFCLISLFTSFAMASSNAQSWIQKGGNITGASNFDWFGNSVSMSTDGSTFAAGSPRSSANGTESGQVRIFSWNGNSWIQKGASINGQVSGDRCGTTVSLSADGNTVAFGSHLHIKDDDTVGQTQIYSWNGSSWTQKGASIYGESNMDFSGSRVAIGSDGNTVALSAIYNSTNGVKSGQVRVLVWNGSDWIQKGSRMNGEAAGDNSGTAIGLSTDGNTLAIGALFNSGNGKESGHIRVYKWNGTEWVQNGTDIDGQRAGDLFGYSLALSADGNTIIGGAAYNSTSGYRAGHARIFIFNGNNWVQKGADINGEADYDLSGRVSISANGNIVAIGANWNNGNGTRSGHTRVYEWTGTTWNQKGADIDGASAESQSGLTVSLSADGSSVAIGGPQPGYGPGMVRVYSVSFVSNLTQNTLQNTLIYNNPVSEELCIHLDRLHSKTIVRITNTQGQLQYSNTFYHTDSITIPMLGEPGMYYAEIISENSTSTVIKVLKQ